MHPWYGKDVFLICTRGEHAVRIEGPDGSTRIVPSAWTSLVPRVPDELDGTIVRLRPSAIASLARWVAARVEARDGEANS